MPITSFHSLLSLTAAALLCACGGGGADAAGANANAGGGTATGSAASATPPAFTPDRWHLAWSDEFSTDGLPDPTRWRYDTAYNASGWFNHELQYYAAARPRNSRVEGGVLVLEAHREAAVGADSGGQGYTSARLVSVGAGFADSVVEVRARLPCGRGTWPALWMLPAAAGATWPTDGEIDLMEHVGHEPATVYTTVHTAAYNHTLGTQKGTGSAVTDVCSTFHRYQLRRTADGLQFAIDDRLVYRFDNDGRGDRRTWPFDQPFALIMNLAVGGDWGGAQGVDAGAFPQRLEVDWVRVWTP